MPERTAEILSAVSQTSRIPEERLKGKGKDGDTCEARAVYFELCRRNGIKRDVATGYINRTPAVMSQYLLRKPNEYAVRQAAEALKKIIEGTRGATKNTLSDSEYRIVDMSNRYSGKMFCVFVGDILIACFNDLEMCEHWMEEKKKK